MNPWVKTEGKCNESVKNEFKIMRKRDSLDQIMKQNHHIHVCFFFVVFF